jgi:hypothetical protein
MKITQKIIMLGLVFFLIHCSSENEEDLQPSNNDRCKENTATLSENIIPIINQSCAISGCHVSGTGRVDLSVKENIIQNATQIRTFTQSGFMPPADSGRTLTAAQKENIYCCVENGAQDN